MSTKSMVIAVGIVGALCTLVTPPLAWGVIGNAKVTVTDTAGNPVAGATISLTSSEPGTAPARGVTDEKGEALIPAEAGTYRVEVTGDDFARTGGEVAVRGGETTAASFTVQPIQPWMGSVPPGGLGHFGIAAGYQGRWFSDLTITQDTFTTSAGRVRSAQESPQQISLGMNGAFVDFPISLPPLELGPVWIYAALIPRVGWFDFELESEQRSTGSSVTFSGDGPVLGGGVEVIVVRCPTCREFLGLGAGYRTNLGVDVRRSVAPQQPGVDIREDAELDYEAWTVSARAGYVFSVGARYVRSIAPWIGILYDWTEVRLDRRVVATFPSGAVQTTDFVAKLESNGPRGWAGVEAHVWGPVFVRGEVVFDASNVDVQFGVSVAIR